MLEYTAVFIFLKSLLLSFFECLQEKHYYKVSLFEILFVCPSVCLNEKLCPSALSLNNYQEISYNTDIIHESCSQKSRLSLSSSRSLAKPLNSGVFCNFNYGISVLCYTNYSHLEDHVVFYKVWTMHLIISLCLYFTEIYSMLLQPDQCLTQVSL